LRDPAVRRLIERRNFKRKTIESYVDGIKDFCNYFGKSPSDLVEWFRGMSDEEIIRTFREWFDARKRFLAPKSLWNWKGAVMALLIENDVKAIDRVSRELAREFRRSVGRVRTLLKRDLATKEEIVKILRVCGPREKALFTLMASSGLRLSSAVNLKLENVKDDLWDTSPSCYMIEIPESISKEGEPYITFMTWEAAEYLRDYLKLREKSGETITPSTYLFISREGNPLSKSRVENMWRDLCLNAGLDMRPVKIPGRLPRWIKGGRIKRVRGVRYNLRIHSLRKFFKTTLTISGVDRLAAEAMMGHSLTQFGVESIYDYAASNIDFLRSEYLKALNNLLFLKKPRGLEIINHAAHKRIEQLERELKKIREERDSLRRVLQMSMQEVESLMKTQKEMQVVIKRLEKNVEALLKTRKSKRRIR